MLRSSLRALLVLALGSFCVLAGSEHDRQVISLKQKEYSFGARVKDVVRKRRFQGEFECFDPKKGVFVNYAGKRQVKVKEFWKFFAALLCHRDWPKYFHSAEGKVENHRERNLRAYFVNHATFLVQIEGVNILTDPIWSKRASPFTFAGPKRVTNPGLKLDELPHIDAVLISHDHYDHLDLETILELKRRFNPKFFVGLGVKELLYRYGIREVEEMAWGESRSLTPAIKVHFVPGQHHSGRGLFDANTSLWGGFVVKSAKFSFYFLGDTGYDEKMFRAVKAKFPSLDLALIPIGAYEKRECLKFVHVNPEEAVLVHNILRPRRSIPMHYGTFRLGTEGYGGPLRDLKAAKAKWGVGEEEFKPLLHGQSLLLEEAASTQLPRCAP